MTVCLCVFVSSDNYSFVPPCLHTFVSMCLFAIVSLDLNAFLILHFRTYVVLHFRIFDFKYHQGLFPASWAVAQPFFVEFIYPCIRAVISPCRSSAVCSCFCESFFPLIRKFVILAFWLSLRRCIIAFERLLFHSFQIATLVVPAIFLVFHCLFFGQIFLSSCPNPNPVLINSIFFI